VINVLSIPHVPVFQVFNKSDDFICEILGNVLSIVSFL